MNVDPLQFSSNVYILNVVGTLCYSVSLSLVSAETVTLFISGLENNNFCHVIFHERLMGF
jgi:hypothetical protein